MTTNESGRNATAETQRTRRAAEMDYEEKETTHAVIGCAIEVHRLLGPGLLGTTYEECFARELALRHIEFERQKSVPVHYKGAVVAASLRLDFLVERTVIVELKSVETLLPLHAAQLLTYLRLSGLRVGLLINFNVKVLRDGIRRKVITLRPSASSAPLRLP
jgi:GxxExxY protein